MSYQVLARKWRPRSFETLVGQEHVVRALTHALNTGRLHHAYLLTGTRGVGKTTIARILAKALNCEQGVSATPCSKCSSCLEVEQGRFVDLLEVDAANNTRVEEMRELIENAVYAPTRGRYKVYVIDEVHMLSMHAFNALLKTLEEPPPHVIFILATTDPQKLPITILSRCLQFNLKQMPVAAIVAHLSYILSEETIQFEKNALGYIAQAADGSMRDALSLLDQAIAFGGGSVFSEQVRDMLGSVDHSYLFNILVSLINEDAPAMLAIAEQMQTRSLSFSNALGEFARILLNIQIGQLAPNALAEDLPDRQRVIDLAKQMSREYVQLAYQIVNQGKHELALAPDEYSGYVMTLLRLLAFAPLSEGETSSTANQSEKIYSKSKPSAAENSPHAITNEAASTSVAAAIIATTTLAATTALAEISTLAETSILVATTSLSATTTLTAITTLAETTSLVTTTKQIATTIAATTSTPQQSTAPLTTPLAIVIAQSTTLPPSITTSTTLIPTTIATSSITATQETTLNPSTDNINLKIIALPSEHQQWLDCIPNLKLSGLALNLAQNSIFVAVQGQKITLGLAADSQHLLQVKSNSDNLQQALTEYFQQKIILEIERTERAELTLGQINRNKQNSDKEELRLAFHNDPTVLELKQYFAAEVQDQTLAKIN